MVRKPPAPFWNRLRGVSLYRLQQAAQIGLLEHVQGYLTRVLQEKQEPRAPGLLRECQDSNPELTPPGAADGHRLALRARDSRQSQLAPDLWVAILKRRPCDPDRVECAFALAPVMVQRCRVELAGRILKHIGRDLDAEGQARNRAEPAGLPRPVPS